MNRENVKSSGCVISPSRFRVTHTDKKSQEGPHPLADSGDQLDQSQDSEEQKEGTADRKEGGYNLRNMFKAPENSNGAPPNVGKRRKSVTLFGLRRSSDPAGVKTAALPGGGGGAGREVEGGKFTIQQQPVVLEEPLQTSGPPDSTKTSNGTAPSSLPIPPPAPSGQMLVTYEEEPYSPGPLQTSTPIGPGPGSIPGLRPSSSTGLPVTHAPPGPGSTSSPDLDAGFGGSLASISLGSSPQSSFPVKTLSSVSSLKTPTSPRVLTPSPKLPQSLRSSASVAVKTASPSPSSSPKLSAVPRTPSQSPIPPLTAGKSPSPLLAHTPSPALSPSPKPTHIPSPALSPSPLLAHIPSPALSPSPKLAHTPSPAISPSPKLAHIPSPALSPSPKLTAMPISQRTPASSPAARIRSLGSSPRLNVRSASVTSMTLTKGDVVATPISAMERELEERELEGAVKPKTDEKTEAERVGIFKADKLSPATVLSSPSEQLLKDRLGSLPVSPSRPLSPSSPLGSRISSVTIVKASPDSKREFSVVTMADEEEQKTEKQRGETSERGVVQVQVGLRLEQKEEAGLAVSQEKDDMVEMEDIGDCKVRQAEEREEVRQAEEREEVRQAEERDEGGEEKTKTVHIQQKQD